MSTELKISDAEWEIMKVLWQNHPITAHEIIEKLEGKQDWNPRTIKTMINRLLKKGAIDHETKGKSYLYSPAVDKAQCIREESKSFMQKIFDGAAAPMLSYFVKNSELSKEEIAELKKILDDKE